MSKKKTPAEDEDLEEEEEAEEAEEKESEEEDESESEDKEESKDEDEEEDDTEEDDSDEEEDEDEDEELDAELEKERKSKLDKEKAREAFLKRKGEREGKGKEDEKGLSRKEVEAILAEDRKDRQESDALAIAQSLTKSEKAAKLIVEKWKNRQFPGHLTLTEQVTEMFGAVYAKRLVGEKNEALRALRNKGRVNRDGSGSHQDARKSEKTPKLPPADLAVIKAAGFKWNNNRWEKKLKSGNLLVRDPKTKRTSIIRKSK